MTNSPCNECTLTNASQTLGNHTAVPKTMLTVQLLLWGSLLFLWPLLLSTLPWLVSAGNPFNAPRPSKHLNSINREVLCALLMQNASQAQMFWSVQHKHCVGLDVGRQVQLHAQEEWPSHVSESSTTVGWHQLNPSNFHQIRRALGFVR